MKVLTFTRLWPSAAMPSHGVFVEERMRRVAALPGVSLEVVAPVPYYPAIPGPARWARWSRVPRVETRHGIRVEHPRYLVLPGMPARAHGRAMLAALWPFVKQLHRQRPIDLLDAHFLHPDGTAAVEIGRRLGVPVVLSARGSDANQGPEDPALREVIRATVGRAAMLIAVSRPIAARLVDLGVAPERIAVIPNGVDASLFSPNPGGGDAVRRHVGCDADDRLVVSVGRLERVKGHDLLLDALAVLARAVRVRAVVVGEGSLRAELEDRAAALGIADRVLFAGDVPHESLAAWYSAADVFCLPSRSEGHPNSLVEAIACGTPAVASAVGGTSDVVSSDCGLLVPPEDAAALATALAAALTRSWDRGRVRARVAARSWERVADSVHSVLEEALERRDRLLPAATVSGGVRP